MKINKYWFKPKRYGYGAYPITWEGIVLIFVFVFVLMLILKYLIHNRLLFYTSFIGMMILLIVISKERTLGDWKWRWGRK